MTKRVDPKKASQGVVVVPQPALPELLSGWKLFSRLEDEADDVVLAYEDMAVAMSGLRHRKSGECPPDLLGATLSDYTKQRIARCRQRLQQLDPEGFYEEDDDGAPILKEEIISTRLAITYTCVDIGGSDPEISLPLLLEHVCDARVSYPALESGCREIEKSKKTRAWKIGEVLEVFKAHEEKWDKRKRALCSIEPTSNYLKEEIRQAEAKYEREQAVKRLEEANWRLSILHSRVKQSAEQIIKSKERAEQAHQNVAARMDQLVKDRAALEAAVAAAEAADAGGDELVARIASPGTVAERLAKIPRLNGRLRRGP